MSAIAPGWYRMDGDPDGQLRWYDGRAWTTHVAPAGASPGSRGVVGETPIATTAYPTTSVIGRVLPPGSRVPPPEMWVIAAAMALTGLLLLYPCLRYGPEMLGWLFSGNDFVRAIGAVVVIVFSMIAAMGVAFLLLAVGLLRASRVAQILSIAMTVYVAVVVIAIGSMTDGALLGGGTATLVCLICAGVIAALVGRRQVRAHFARDTRPLGVAAAATANAYFVWVLMVDGFVSLVAGTVSGGFLVGGVLLLGAALVVFKFNKPLRDGSRQARTVILTAYAVIGLALIVFTAAGNGSGIGLIVPLAALGAGAAGLTTPESSKRHFGDVVTPRVPAVAKEHL